MLTKKFIEDNYKHILLADEGYNLPYEKIGSNSGTYGWNWSAYKVDNDTVIVRGYRSFPKYTAVIDKEAANKIGRQNIFEVPMEERKKQYDELIEKTIREEKVKQPTKTRAPKLGYKMPTQSQLNRGMRR